MIIFVHEEGTSEDILVEFSNPYMMLGVLSPYLS